jgi:diguanylate cyclase (GGDEF)-like protein
MRSAFKAQIAANQAVYKGDEAVYDEISLLNNELVTLQRVLAKKNAALQRLNAKYQKMAVTDALTEVFNRRGLFEIGSREVERATRYTRPLSVITLDLDNFKTINDTYGHPMGDEVLREVAKCCVENLRKVDFIGRYGGDEFIILLPETGPNEARGMAERLLMLISNLVIDGWPEELHVTVSMGIASLESTPMNFAELLRRSDHALLCAKRNGRNAVYGY